jgi:hypothetical protein
VATPTILFAGAYMVTPLPAPTYPIDVSAGVPVATLGMLGNGPDPTLTITTPNGPGQPVGDCYFAGVVHKKRVDATAGNEATDLADLPDSNETVDAYDVYDNGQDQGVVMSDAMQTWFTSGFPGSSGSLVIDRCEAFLKIDPTEMYAAMDYWNTPILVGVNLPDAADQQFSEQQPWSGPPDANDGHVVVLVGSKGPAATDLDDYITWGAYQQATKQFSAPLASGGCVEEAWLPVTSEMLRNARINIDQVLAGIRAAGGEAVPNPTPAPTPPAPVPPAPTPPHPAPTPAPPGPTPGPAPVPSGVIPEIEADAEKAVEEVEKLAEDAIHDIESA